MTQILAGLNAGNELDVEQHKKTPSAAAGICEDGSYDDTNITYVGRSNGRKRIRRRVMVVSDDEMYKESEIDIEQGKSLKHKERKKVAVDSDFEMDEDSEVDKANHQSAKNAKRV